MRTLYKFLGSPDAVKYILNGIVKFTPIPELNDPSELVPSMDKEAVLASLHELRAEGYSDEDLVHLQQQGAVLRALAPRFQKVPVPRSRTEANRLIQSLFYESLDTLEDQLGGTAREISGKVGLFCLSRRFNSLPMWAHYAANAAGLAVEFKGLGQVFGGDETGILRELIPIDYRRQSLGITFKPESHRSLFFAKFRDWGYEKEVRVVLPLADCQKFQTPERTMYTYAIPRTCVKRLILGWNMSAKNLDVIKELVAANNPEVEISYARYIKGKVGSVPLA